MHLDIDERHLLRLGHGEEMLETEKDFSRYGRVNYVLQQRLALLKEVNRLQKSLGVQGDVSYTCETAGHFYLYQVLSRWEKFQDEINLHKKTVEGTVLKIKKSHVNENIIYILAENGNYSSSIVSEKFPFHLYFSNAPQPVFKGQDFEEELEIANGCWYHIKNIFEQLGTAFIGHL